MMFQKPEMYAAPPKRGKPIRKWDRAVGTYRELVAAQVAGSARESDTLGDLHARFCAKFKCPACGEPVVCTHRNRTADIQLILGATTVEAVN